jgi:hypothetical protein
MAKRGWARASIGLGVALLVPGVVIFATTGGGISPALVIGLVLLMLGLWVGGYLGAAGRDRSGPPLPPPPPGRADPPEEDEV